MKPILARALCRRKKLCKIDRTFSAILIVQVGENNEKLKCIEEGWLKDCRQIPSEYFDERPDPKDISLLVIHYISLPPEQFGGGYIDDFFQGKLDPCLHPYFKEIYQMSVSAHCLIDRCGVITQYVNFNDRAWHAGISSFEDRERCNDFPLVLNLKVAMNCLLPMRNMKHCNNLQRALCLLIRTLR
ncbi:1,6-anhydro-N-acetylmuramyl-L-alanine amidase AmpD [Rodentibacter pneumotropicus]|uniref:1,6-anhydro-N-acetylmuramyl-L-alanine amidase AmpD n=1 Tax=Rodentibacter pneumotropicus TaxID=758 RepID=A0A3S4URQ8_9PAST|nr:1,6-anhydro-N-acetylmuramyl-L-alanine amidase AmpD [Rodentibacter pneumotropicus]